MSTIVEQPGQSMTRRINDLIWRSLEHGRVEAVPFFCECDRGCYSSVWVTPAQYASLRETEGWLALARGHRPLPSAT